jgi:flagellar L-ring protein precursor FlgH
MMHRDQRLVTHVLAVTVLLTFGPAAWSKDRKPKDKEPVKTPLEQYVEGAHQRANASASASPGSLWSVPSPLMNLAGDVRAQSIDDIVTIVVSESASAVSTGTTKAARTSSANAGLTSAAGRLSVPARLANIVTANSAQTMDGTGTTTRQTTLTTTITARVIDVLPNGNLVIEGTKNTMVNSENQTITLRGVIRPTDLTNANTVLSGNVAQMELKVNGKGVVNDYIHRPNFLYRLLLGALHF